MPTGPAAWATSSRLTPDNSFVTCAESPYRWICGLELIVPRNGGEQRDRGTGVLISPRHVLTVAHNVMPKAGVEALRITVTPGQDGMTVFGKPHTIVRSMTLEPANWWVPETYRNTRHGSWDFAVLTLPGELPAVKGTTYGHWGDTRYSPTTLIAPVRPGELAAGTPLTLAGYPGDKCGKEPCTMLAAGATTTDRRARKDWASTLWEAGGRVQNDPPPGVILHDMDTFEGMSGSPIWDITPRRELRLVALHGGSYSRVVDASKNQWETLGQGIPLVAQLVDLVRKRVRGDLIRPAF